VRNSECGIEKQAVFSLLERKLGIGFYSEFRIPNSALESVVMKGPKMSDYRGMSDEQLQLALRDLEKNLFHLRFQSATDRLETPSELRKAKREIARVKTVQRERELRKELAANG
jgi:large subunit ribosomal protein L29